MDPACSRKGFAGIARGVVDIDFLKGCCLIAEGRDIWVAAACSDEGRDMLEATLQPVESNSELK